MKHFTCLFLLFYSSIAWCQSVSNVVARTEGEQITISYDLAGNAGESYEVKISCSKDGGKTFAVTPNNVNGAVNRWEAPGNSKIITWAAKKDLGEFEGDLQFKVIASGKGGVNTSVVRTNQGISNSSTGSATAETDQLSFSIVSVFNVPEGFKVVFRIKAKSDFEIGLLNTSSAQDQNGNLYTITSGDIESLGVLTGKTRKFIANARKDGEMILKISKMNSASLTGRMLQSLTVDTTLGSIQLNNLPRF
jgi:hypothetical protein